MKSPANIAGIILAAGASRRMGCPKALLKFADGTTLLARQRALLKGAGCDEIAVVVGSGADEIKNSHAHLEVAWIENRSWGLGQFSSVQAGIRWALSRDAAGAIILPVDVIGVKTTTIARIIDVALHDADARAIIPEYGGRGGHPVYVTMEFCRSLVSADPRSRLDREIAATGHIVRLPAFDPNVVKNINAPEEWNPLTCS